MPSFRFFLFIVINFAIWSTNRVNALAIGNPTNISERKLRDGDVISDDIVRVNDADAKSTRVYDKLELLVGKTVDLKKFEGKTVDFSKLKNFLREKDLSGLKAYLKKHPVKLNKSFYKRVQAIVNEDPVESRGFSPEKVDAIVLLSFTLFFVVGGITYAAVAS